MTTRFLYGILAFGLLVCGVARVDAQTSSKPIEIGFDGQLAHVTGDNSSTSLTIPISAIRVGLQLTDKIEIEPQFTLGYVQAGSDHATSYGVAAGLIWNLSADRTKSQWYARPF